MINVGINQASAVLKAPYGVFQTSSKARGLMTMLMEEVITLATSLLQFFYWGLSSDYVCS